MAKYLYYALFESEENGQYSVSFPDLPGCLTFGDDMSDALYMAKDVLEGWMIDVENDNESIPAPSYPNEITVPTNALLIPIEVDTKIARIKFGNKAINKTLTIPYWLDELAKASNINFSQVLQEGLKKQLGITDLSQIVEEASKLPRGTSGSHQ